MSYPDSRRRPGLLPVLIFCALQLLPSPNALGSTRIVDDLGRVTVLPHGARRIVALDPTSVEVLYAVGASGRVVGVGSYTNYPPEATKLPKLDGLAPSREVLIGLHPDLVILNDQQMTASVADQRARLYGVPLFVTNSRTYAEVEAKVARMGAYFGRPTETRQAIEKMRHAMGYVRSRVKGRPSPSVFFVVWSRPLMTGGRGSFITDMISLAGGRDVAAKAQPYSEYPAERLVGNDPDIILVDADSYAQTKRELAGIRLHAIESGRLYAFSDDLVVRAGPRLADGLIVLAKLIHPEAFARP